MNTVDLLAGSTSTRPRRLHARSAGAPHPLLWIAGAVGLAVLVFTVALVLGRLLLPNDAVAVQITPPVQDPFYQQKLDAKQEELPAQF
jgi:hypothetical protein